MTVTIERVDGSNQATYGEGTSYAILSSGVLQILSYENNQWKVEKEFSPSAWEVVYGDRQRAQWQ